MGPCDCGHVQPLLPLTKALSPLCWRCLSEPRPARCHLPSETPTGQPCSGLCSHRGSPPTRAQAPSPGTSPPRSGLLVQQRRSGGSLLEAYSKSIQSNSTALAKCISYRTFYKVKVWKLAFQVYSQLGLVRCHHSCILCQFYLQSGGLSYRISFLR